MLGSSSLTPPAGPRRFSRVAALSKVYSGADREIPTRIIFVRTEALYAVKLDWQDFGALGGIRIRVSTVRRLPPGPLVRREQKW